ncbi:pyridoxamine 5'-phosphate oxidase family protein [Streptomyces sp. JJ66]|uniref:pyridoxamine 5'-phosphate oxidase family protein n=1 Tax=Streptomyces sp. JJ66 TaxID=2803843 RepID=UPI001C591199|nr:pyridoxamine 5'-phosphate oxidase family protein [Streptomyces sp. JJ66]MBW1602366.1 pyridoxamine 5'-phosphate oxidase family protein [Streptomyces sp. JJ66]
MTSATAHRNPVTELDARFSQPGARPTPWPEAAERLAAAELYWLTTVRADGRPHVTPLIAVSVGETLHFCTGPAEQKARNLERDAHCVLTTGCNSLNGGEDLVVEGEAVRVTDEARLARLASAYVAKYGPEWSFGVRDGAFVNPGSADPALVFAVVPTRAFGFAKGSAEGEPYGQTRWRF